MHVCEFYQQHGTVLKKMPHWRGTLFRETKRGFSTGISPNSYIFNTTVLQNSARRNIKTFGNKTIFLVADLRY
jgi:hypothetical protein